MLKYILLCTICTFSFTAQAGLYKIINEYGEVIYTDTAPSIDAKEHKLGRITSVANPVFNAEKIKADKEKLEKQGKKGKKGKRAQAEE